MNAKRRDAIEHAARTVLPSLFDHTRKLMPSVAKAPPELEFYEQDNTIFSQMQTSKNKLRINCKALAFAMCQNFPSNDFESHKSILGWLIGRELYFFHRGEDHETDRTKLGPLNAAAFMEGYNKGVGEIN